MARSPPAFVAVFQLVLVLLTLDAAQGQEEPFPLFTDPSDADALHAVFRRWQLEVEGGAAREDPCRKRFWSQPSGINASVECKCSFSGCRITTINVTGNWNISEIPRELFNLTELLSLDLSNNNLSGSIPPEVVNLSKLETWRFNNNPLSGAFPHELSLLRNLQSLWMFDNYIEGPFPDFIQNLTKLTDLRIYGTKLQGPIPNNFSSLSNLEVLMLGDIAGNHSYFNIIGAWANLSVLSLRKCGLTGQVPNTPPNLPKLKYLDLTSNNLSGSIGGLLLSYKTSNYTYVGGNNFSGPVPSEIVQSAVSLDVSYNYFVNGSLPNNPSGQKQLINYIGTSIDASGRINSGNLTILNCLRMDGCNIKNLTNHATSFAINCGGKQVEYSDPMPIMFSEDSTDLGGSDFHINETSHWVVSHVGSDPFNESTGIVNTSDIVETNMQELYQTARTSTSSLWYYVVGLANGNYTVQLFFAEIVITYGPGKRLFDIDIQGQTIRKDFDITKEAGGSRKATNITYEVTVDSSILVIHLYWSGRGTCCIPYEGAYGPLVSAIKVTHSAQDPKTSPPQAPHSDSGRKDEKRRGVVAGIAALCIAAAVISSSVVYLWWKWVSLMKRPMV